MSSSLKSKEETKPKDGFGNYKDVQLGKGLTSLAQLLGG